MKIAVLGAGAMGSLFGGLLAESGQAVTLIDVNDAHVGAVREHGLRLETDAGDRRLDGLHACRPEQAEAAPDLLLIFTKTLHTAAALEAVAHIIAPHTLVLTLQNGLGNVETVRRHVPEDRILVGVTTWPADYVGPGHVRSHGAGMVRIMAVDGRDDPLVRSVVRVLDGAGLNGDIDPQVWKAIWEKVAFNAALNGICAVTGCSVDQVGAIPQGMVLASSVVAEVVAVARAEGIDADADRCCRTVADAVARHLGHKPSMLQDVLAGRPTETGAIHGAVVERARKHGLAVPCTETLLQLVRLIEARNRSSQATGA